jgi:hypothetical protein
MVAERETLEPLALREVRGVVEIAEQVVERAVLAHQHHEVRETGLGLRVGHRARVARSQLVADHPADDSARDDAGGRGAAYSQEVTPARAVPVWLTVFVHPTISTDVFRKWWISVNP